MYENLRMVIMCVDWICHLQEIDGKKTFNCRKTLDNNSPVSTKSAIQQ